MLEFIDRKNTNSLKWDDLQNRFNNENLLPLWVADMDIASPKAVQEAIIKRASHPIYGYTIYPKDYFDSIIDWLKEYNLTKKDIIPSYGVVLSLYISVRAFSKENDGIIIQTPIYPPFISSVKHQKRKILENRLIYENGKYSIDFKDLEEKAKEAKMLLLCSPHNPTGRVWTKNELKKIVDIATKYDLIIVSDEIHSDMSFKPFTPISTLFDNTITLNAPSKTFNIAGLHTSFTIIKNSSLKKRYEIEQKKSGVDDPNPFGVEALKVAYTQKEWLIELKEYLRENRNFVKAFLKDNNIPIKQIEMEATFLMWLDCKELNLSQKELVSFFIEKANLGLNDGASFGKNGEGFMRLNIGTSKDTLKQAMQQLNKAYRSIK